LHQKIIENRVKRLGHKGTICEWTGDQLVAIGCIDLEEVVFICVFCFLHDVSGCQWEN